MKTAVAPMFAPCVIIDTREQEPFMFAAIPADAGEGAGLLRVRTARHGLRTGDYSLFGHHAGGTADTPAGVCIERKSKKDLYGTVAAGRSRFERELSRMAGFLVARIVVECELSELLASPPEHTRYSPKSLHRTIIAWEQRFPRVHWLFCPNRRFAEVKTLRVLDRYWREYGGGSVGDDPPPDQPPEGAAGDG